MNKKLSGTLAVDLGNTNTVIAFQEEYAKESILIEIRDITTTPGVVPTAVWCEKGKDKTAIGAGALKMKNTFNSEKYFHSNFKRLIGNPIEKHSDKYLSPIESGEKFFKVLIANLPKEIVIKRLVLTAPIDTYKGYRKWLVGLCKELQIKEIALVDEPTAAGIGIDIPMGSENMIIDIGGSTIDMNIIKLQGGEGRAAPIAELLKFNGNNVSEISKQKLRCAEIISKSGSKIGGKDIDQWIINHFIPSNNDERNLSRAETIKCKLSSPKINSEQKYLIKLFIKNEEKDFYISKEIFEEILIKNNLLNHLNNLLKNLLNEARGKFFDKKDLNTIILVGGGTQIPLIKEWIVQKIPEVKINTPPPIESIALGALAMTPGVKIKDILIKGISIRLFNRRENKHFWHPIFFKGQTWPTEKPYELILQASKDGQNIFEIIIGETKEKKEFDVVFENGIPKLSESQPEEDIIKWNKKPLKLILKNQCKIGKDSIKLFFKITSESYLFLQCMDMEENKIGEYNLGSIF